MKNLLSVLALILSTMVAAQNPTLLKVTGESEVRVVPDEALVSLNLEGTGSNSESANREAELKLKAVQNTLRDLGYDESLLKVLNSNVYAVRKYAEKKPSSYRANIYGEIKLPANSIQVTKFIEVLAQRGQDVNSNVRYAISDDLAKSKRDELVKKALDDASDKASNIAQHMGMKIEKVAIIQYNQRSNTPQFARMDIAMEAGTEGVSYELKDKVLRESIYVEFYLK